MWITSKGYVAERITDADTGLQKIVTVKIHGESEKAKQEAYRKLQSKIEHLSDKRVKLSEAIDTYISEIERELKPSSVRKAKIELNSVLKILGDAYMENLTAGYIRKKFMESGRENRTLNGYMKIFKTFWMWCYRNDLVNSREVFDKLALFQDTPKKARIQDKYLEPDEVSKLLAAMTEKRHSLVFRFTLLSGLRIGEFIALNNTDVWGKYIRVSKTYDPNNKIITSAKTYSSTREVFIQDELREVIEEIHEYTSWQKEAFGYESDLFFPNEEGGYFHYETYAKYLRELSERVLQKRITPHYTRHTHTSMLAARGMNLEAISTRLGHEDSRITKEIYLHRLEELKEKENEQLNQIRIIG